jgi:hypothetical protein
LAMTGERIAREAEDRKAGHGAREIVLIEEKLTR